MAELNVIKTRQLDLVDFGNYLSGLLSNSFASLFSNYLVTGGDLGTTPVYAGNVTQTISGTKTFTNAPYLPYSGLSGQAISKKYVDDTYAVLNSGMSNLLGSSFVYATGDQSITGVKTFNGNVKAITIQNAVGGNQSIDFSQAGLLNSGGAITLNWNSLSLFGQWTSNGSPIVNTDSAQTINGVKTFTGGAKVPFASSPDFAVPYGQFITAINSITQQVNDFTNTVSTGQSSGFAGVISFNRASGNIFTQGRGNVTVWQQGNITNISGADIVDDTEGAFAASRVYFATGRTRYDIPISGFVEAPFVLAQLGSLTSGNPVIDYYITNTDTGNFTVLFNNTVTGTGYYLDYLTLDTQQIIGFLKGEQGLLGDSLHPRGNWSTGNAYGFLDLVTTNGVSWIATGTHVSDNINSPTGVSGSSYWQLLASGSGPKGDSATLFIYKGYWNSSTTYHSGDGVSFSGATYGTLSTTFAGQSPTGSPWYLLSDKGSKGDGFRFRGDFNSSTVYNSGDVVHQHRGTYVYTGSNAVSGDKNNPLSLISPWSVFNERPISYIEPYNPSTIYYKNDLVRSNISGFNSGESVQYINTSDDPLYALHPYGLYNEFMDCDGFTGQNLFVVGTGLKDQNHPYYGIGSSIGFTINGIPVNESGLGIGALTLIRGNTYFFDSELSSVPFILTTDSTGNGYNGQINDGVSTGARLSVNPANYLTMGLNTSVYSGTMLFVPNINTPDILYYQSPASGGMGFRLNIVDASPWSVFVSGTKGNDGSDGLTGPSGAPGGGIIFNWRGTYNQSNYYGPDDAVEYSGSSYGYTGSGYTIGDAPPGAPWSLVASKGNDGQDAKGLAFIWRGTWSASSGYAPNDAVYYNGASYATTGSPSGNFPPPNFPASWFVVAQKGATGSQGAKGDPGLGFVWRGVYNSGTNYSSGDAVFYQGSSYGAITSGSGIIPTTSGQTQWDLVSQAGGSIFSWRNTFDPFQTYFSGDAVFYQGSSYATLADTTGEIPTTSPWFLVAQAGAQGPSGLQGNPGAAGLAFVWRGTWTGGSGYNPYDAVYYNGTSYGTQSNITGGLTTQAPDVSAFWFPIAKQGNPGLAFNWQGTWSPAGVYSPNDAVYYNGSSYATQFAVNNGTSPDNPPWFLISKRGDAILDIPMFFNTVTTGKDQYEKIIASSFTFTGFAVGLATPATTGTPLSGSFYKRNTNQVRVTLTGFSIPANSGFLTSGAFAFTLSQFDRVGLDISGGSGFNGSGLSVNLFGYLN